MDLIIVESPSKAKTIAKYLKNKYMVDASAGHVRDLPTKKLGVDIKNNFEPTYVINKDKKDVIKRLKEEVKKADHVYLATDPDREGEAISWHLQQALNLKGGKNRIVFNEITATAVTKALENPREIDQKLVDTQQARRVLDRIVGYTLSPLLSKKIQPSLSAGRVQSVALRMVVEREREIMAFKPEEYWTIVAELFGNDSKKVHFKAQLIEKNKKKIKPKCSDEVEKIKAELRPDGYIVHEIKKSIAKSHALPPFTTSTLQQDASNKLSMSSPDTMRVAQQLYEGIDVAGEGHIALVTYIRTDSVRVSQEAQIMAVDYIKNTFGKEYIPAKPNVYKTSKAAQDAHECIRPIDLARTPDSLKSKLDAKQYKLYKLIYNRFLASQMTDATYNSMQIKINNGDYTLKASGRTPLFAGYTLVYQEQKKESEEQEDGKLLPNLVEQEKLNFVQLQCDQKFTKPPARYTDASLVKAMEEKAIGRPSTYATIISVLNKRQYVKKMDKTMAPTDVSFKICDMLVEYFPDVVDIGFTAKMEDRLDNLEGEWQSILQDFYPDFEKKLQVASKPIEEMTDIVCEKCGSFMLKRYGKYNSHYLACSNYPTCKNIVSNEEISDKQCPQCGNAMVIKTGRYGQFLSCSNYPTCKTNMPLESEIVEEKCPHCGGTLILQDGKFGKYYKCLQCNKNIPAQEKLGIACPNCQKDVIVKKTKTGKIFYGCIAYPECNFTSWDMPTGEFCPKCNAYLVKKPKSIQCSNTTCDYRINTEIKES